MQQRPAVVNHFEGQKIIAVAAGDEFSMAVDARCYPWGWGRAELGQVRMYEVLVGCLYINKLSNIGIAEETRLGHS